MTNRSCQWPGIRDLPSGSSAWSPCPFAISSGHTSSATANESPGGASEWDVCDSTVGGLRLGLLEANTAYGCHEVLEGPEIEGVVILEFPSLDDAKAWYDSPACREVQEHRFRGSDYRAVIVEGA
jgi:hypothetical protein